MVFLLIKEDASIPTCDVFNTITEMWKLKYQSFCKYICIFKVLSFHKLMKQILTIREISGEQNASHKFPSGHCKDYMQQKWNPINQKSKTIKW